MVHFPDSRWEQLDSPRAFDQNNQFSSQNLQSFSETGVLIAFSTTCMWAIDFLQEKMVLLLPLGSWSKISHERQNCIFPQNDNNRCEK